MAQTADKLDVPAVRERFTSLDQGFTFFDAPGGSQVPDEVGDAIARALREASANMGAGYETSRRVGRILEQAESGAARFLGCEPHEVIFGSNMTSLNFTLSRTAGREFAPGDEILVSSLDHDGGVAPWLELAYDRDLVVKHVELRRRHHARLRGPREQARRSDAGGRLRLGLERDRDDRRRPARVPSSPTTPARWPGSTPSTTPRTSRSTSAQIDADVLICSPYKFCGPHLGMAYGRAEVIERWRPYKARPAPSAPLGRRFETGTQPYELLAGFNATLDYLNSIGGFELIVPYERALGERFLSGISDAVQRLRPADDGGPRADVPGQRRGRPGRAMSRRGSPSSRWASGPTTPGTR